MAHSQSSKTPSQVNQNPKEQSPSYLTKCVEEVAFLRFMGFRLVGQPEGDGRYKWARFANSTELQKAVQDFFNGCDAKRLFDELRNAKQYLMD